MNQKTHPSETALDEFCREIVGVAQASEADIHAAAHAPFLYQRLRAQIAAEQTPLATIVPPRSSTWNFVAAFGAWQNRWRWMWATAAVGLVLLAGWRWLNPAPAAPAIAQQEMTSTVTPAQNKAMKKPEPLAPSAPEQLVPTVPAERQMVKATRKAPRFASRFAAETVAEETEIYAADLYGKPGRGSGTNRSDGSPARGVDRAGHPPRQRANERAHHSRRQSE
jgi:hypothetical protein